MGCPLRIIFLVEGYGKGDAARNTVYGDDKAQNDRRLVSNVGCLGWENKPGTTNLTVITEGVRRPS